ncbi:hypothetical protein [Synechococcus sp. UW69]|uniref:hypothetical protein n=1 Tax=Synechococcus sp. UW69 TaxID=368493 RepID=UPI0010BCF605|nr:hypothetical protein [Synechococcus sp. UW69]
MVIPFTTPADHYIPSDRYQQIFGVPKIWPHNRWVHLIHNWRTGGSSLTALLSVNVHDSYLKIGHPFTRCGWPVPYDVQPLQITEAKQLKLWIKSQKSPAILAGHTYAGMPLGLGISDYDKWITMREPASRMNSGLLRFHRKTLRSDSQDGGYVGKTKGCDFSSPQQIIDISNNQLSHELNGMTRRLAGYAAINSHESFSSDLESCELLDNKPIDQSTFDLAMDYLSATNWIYLTDQVLPSILILESLYGLKPFIHPCSDLIHNPQWNASGVTRIQQSLLSENRSLLESLNQWDVKLFSRAKSLFWSMWKECDVPPARLKARRILQCKPLISPVQLKKDSANARKVIESKINFRIQHEADHEVQYWIEKDGLGANFWKHL